jgi:hypothetical protein
MFYNRNLFLSNRKGKCQSTQDDGPRSLSDNLDQNALPAPAVELTVKDQLPRAKVEPPVGDCHHHLAAHDLPLEMGVANLSLGPGQASSSVRL